MTLEMILHFKGLPQDPKSLERCHDSFSLLCAQDYQGFQSRTRNDVPAVLLSSNPAFQDIPTSLGATNVHSLPRHPERERNENVDASALNTALGSVNPPLYSPFLVDLYGFSHNHPLPSDEDIKCFMKPYGVILSPPVRWKGTYQLHMTVTLGSSAEVNQACNASPRAIKYNVDGCRHSAILVLDLGHPCVLIRPPEPSLLQKPLDRPEKNDDVPAPSTALRPERFYSLSPQVIDISGFPKDEPLPSDDDVSRFMEPFGAISGPITRWESKSHLIHIVAPLSTRAEVRHACDASPLKFEYGIGEHQHSVEVYLLKCYPDRPHRTLLTCPTEPSPKPVEKKKRRATGANTVLVSPRAPQIISMSDPPPYVYPLPHQSPSQSLQEAQDLRNMRLEIEKLRRCLNEARNQSVADKQLLISDARGWRSKFDELEKETQALKEVVSATQSQLDAQIMTNGVLRAQLETSDAEKVMLLEKNRSLSATIDQQTPEVSSSDKSHQDVKIDLFQKTLDLNSHLEQHIILDAKYPPSSGENAKSLVKREILRAEVANSTSPAEEIVDLAYEKELDRQFDLRPQILVVKQEASNKSEDSKRTVQFPAGRDLKRGLDNGSLNDRFPRRF